MGSARHSPQDIAVLKRLAQILNDLGIPYAIGGSLASSAYGAARFTQDADIAVAALAPRAREFLQQVAGEFYISGAAMEEALRTRGSFNLIHFESAFKIDIFVLEDTAFAEEMMKRRIRLSVGEPGSAEFEFVSPEDILLLKLRWYLRGGCVSERQWRDVLTVLAVQHGGLDLAYLSRWAASLGLTDLLEKALAEAAAR